MKVISLLLCLQLLCMMILIFWLSKIEVQIANIQPKELTVNFCGERYENGELTAQNTNN